jgi:hypothetical protein
MLSGKGKCAMHIATSPLKGPFYRCVDAAPRITSVLFNGMKQTLLGIFWMLCSLHATAQTSDSLAADAITHRIFLPSLDVGYLLHSSPQLGNAVIIKASIEYRQSNIEDFFVRLNYDTYNARYNISNANGTTNILVGRVFFSDLLGGPGYRLGDHRHRFEVLVQGGVKFYDYPQALINNNVIEITQENKSVPTGRLSLGYEYYLNSKSAFTLELMYGRVFRQVDFWQFGPHFYGASVGFVTSID